MKKLFLLAVISITVNAANAQGCSDAGFCTVPSLAANTTVNVDNASSKMLRVGASVGLADHGIFIFSNHVGVDLLKSDKQEINLKLTMLSQNGKEFMQYNFGDFYASYRRKIAKQVDATLGVKIPLGNGGKICDSLALPMDYQPTLGTTDIIAGIGYTLNKLQLNVGIQQPITQNKNTFFANNSNGVFDSSFVTTNKFKRKGDVLLRGTYLIGVNKKFNISPSALFIYHLGEDKYTDANNVQKNIAGSSGATFNINVLGNYALSTKDGLNFALGMPLLVRKVRPDGLTRAFVATIEYTRSL